MAGLTRKFMDALGVASEAQDEIFNRYNEVLSEIKAERDEYRAKAEQLDTVTAERDKLKSRLDDPKQADRIAELEKQNQDLQAEITGMKRKDMAYDFLKKSGFAPESFDKVVKLANLLEQETGEDGRFKDGKKLSEQLRADYPEYVLKTVTQTAKPATPPATEASGITKEQIMNIKDKSERRMAIAQNLDLFNQTKGE